MPEDLPDVKEKRRYVRIDTTLEIHMKTSSGSDGSIYKGTTNNISEGGLCMQTEENVDELLTILAEEDFTFNVSIRLMDPDKVVEVDAVMRWTSSTIEWVKLPPHKQKVLNVGLAFQDISEDTRKLIQHHMKNRSKKKG